MKSLLKVFLLAVLLTMMVPKVTANAQTGDYVADAIQALKTSKVYVAPGTPGTDSNTISQLSSYLTADDNIVLVMLPPDAANGTDIPTIAKNISDGLSNTKTVGLAVGNLVYGYSVILPSGIASDQMIRANSVSNSQVTALSTFSRNIRIWLDRNPQPTFTPSPEPTRTPRPTMEPIRLPKFDGSTTQGKVSIGFVALVLIVFAAFLAIKVAPRLIRNMKFGPAERTLSTIESLVVDISDLDIKRELTKACKLARGLLDIFKRSSKYIGIVEDLFPPLLENIVTQINALNLHELGIQPIPNEKFDKMVNVMLNYDDLFKKLQENDPATVDLLTSIFMSENTMVSHLGYFPTKKSK